MDMKLFFAIFEGYYIFPICLNIKRPVLSELEGIKYHTYFVILCIATFSAAHAITH